MNDSDQSSLALFWLIPEIIPRIGIDSELHKEWMILTTVVFQHSDELKKLSHTLRLITDYVGSDWFLPEFFSTILMNSSSDPTHWGS